MENKNIELLKSAIKKVVETLSLEKDEFKGLIVSGSKSTYDTFKLTGIKSFETTIVELLIKNILKEKNDDNFKIGWEVAYPNPKWGRAKLDLGLDFIEESQFLFRIAVEVKKISETEIQQGMMPYKVWDDIFKISGYNDERTEAGEHKFVLVFFEKQKNKTKEEITEILKEAFVLHFYFNCWMEKKMKEKNYNGENIYRFFLEQERKKKSYIDALKYLGLEDGAKDKKFIEFEKIDDSPIYLKDNSNVGAVLLKVQTV